MAVIDPGPDVAPHVRALASAVAGSDEITILVTHHHGDHAAAAPSLAAALAAESGAVVAGPEGIDGVERVLEDGDVVETDEGPLVAVHTPGHSRDHLCFHWPEREALFAGDLLLGVGHTTWVAEYPGCVADYLASLDRLRSLDLDVVYPAHGPPIEDPAGALDRFEDHRRARIEQVREAIERNPDADADALLDAVYGLEVPESLRGAALRSLLALVEYVEHTAGP